MVDDTEYHDQAVDFLSGMMTKSTGAKNIIKVLAEHPGWELILFCDGPHMLGPVLILRKQVTDG